MSCHQSIVFDYRRVLVLVFFTHCTWGRVFLPLSTTPRRIVKRERTSEFRRRHFRARRPFSLFSRRRRDTTPSRHTRHVRVTCVVWDNTYYIKEKRVSCFLVFWFCEDADPAVVAHEAKPHVLSRGLRAGVDRHVSCRSGKRGVGRFRWLRRRGGSPGVGARGGRD